MRSAIAALLALFLAAPLSPARKWTSANGARSFEADLIDSKDGKVTVRRSDGRTLTFALDLLSKADREFVAEASKTPAVPAAPAGGVGNDWPRFRGPDINDHSPDTGLLKTWPAGGPERVWLYRDAGVGYAGPSIAGGKLFTMGARDAVVSLICLDAATGDELWTAEVGAFYRNNWGDGPRSTPTVDGDRVYALGAKGNLLCASISDGEKIWEINLKKDFDGGIPGWGYCESVLIDGDNVICTPGGGKGAILALDKMTGTKLWQSTTLTDGAQYSSLIPIEHDGKRQYVQLFQKTLAGVSATDGELLWRSNWGGRTAVVPTPIHKDGKVYIASGYGVGCKLVKLGANGSADDVWQNDVIVNHHGGVILVDDHLYGHSDNGGWKCQKFDTGEEVWKSGKLGKGAVHYADGMLYCLEEKSGTVALVEASTDGWNEKGRFTLKPQTELRKKDGRIWTHPVVVNGMLYLRDQDLIFCYKVKG